ncbi:MAG: AAA family ATPase [Propioniciclava sp.]
MSRQTVIIAGVAGSGKSTLGRAVARVLGLPLVDLDSVTNPLLDALTTTMAGHWLSGPAAEQVRAGRYAALRSVSRDIVATHGAVVVVAPFTAELRGGDAWEALLQAIAPGEPVVVHLVGDPDLLAERRRRRGEPRDVHRPDSPAVDPVMPVITLDTALSTQQQLTQLLVALGGQPLQ